MPGTFSNTLLNSLDAATISRLRLRYVAFELEHEIEFPGKHIEHLFFVEEGVASLTTTFKDGSQVEAGMFGYESVIGISALMGTKRSLNRVYTQIAGHGYSCTIEDGEREFRLGGLFQKLALRYVQAQLVQAIQSAGCNAKHDLEHRLARWLLICADRANSLTFRMSHQYLAEILGANRSTVSSTAALLKAKDLIEYKHGTILVLDAPRLEKSACECYQTIRAHLSDLEEFESTSLA